MPFQPEKVGSLCFDLNDYPVEVNQSKGAAEIEYWENMNSMRILQCILAIFGPFLYNNPSLTKA